MLANLLEKYSCPARNLTLEITETAILGDPDLALKNMERLQALGCRLSIDDFGHNMGLKVVAEGIEILDVLHQLRHMGCDVAQGYLISRPINAVALGRWAGGERLSLVKPGLAQTISAA